MRKIKDDFESVEVELIRVVDRLRAMKLGRYACKMWDGSTVKIEIKKKKKPESPIGTWEDRIAAWLKNQKRSEVVTAQVLDALRVGAKKRTRADEMRAAECMRRLGWTKSRHRNIQGTLSYFWKRTEDGKACEKSLRRS